MSYHYTESGLSNVWLDSGYTIENDPRYGELISIDNVRGLHDAIGLWLVAQPRTLIGAEFRFLRTELDMSQRVVADLVGATEQSVAKWEKAREKPVANKAAERILRVAYKEYVTGSPSFSEVIDRVTQLDAELAEIELHLSQTDSGWSKAA